MKALTQITNRATVVLYPTFGHLVDEGRAWRISVSGTVYLGAEATLQHRILLRLLRQFLRVDAAAMQSEVFQHRIRGFIAATERGKRIEVQIGEKTYPLRRKSRRNGHFSGAVHVPVQDVEHLVQCDPFNRLWLKMLVGSEHHPTPHFLGQAQLIDDAGVSIVSDIDDTIKHSHVLCRRTLLANTFLKEFETIEGMAVRYREWAAQGAVFHYVSSSPWQLYGPLAELREVEDFPAGTFHLRAFRLRDHMLRRLLLIRRPGKGAVIRRLVRTFPRRKFVLVGDSGELDPELYGDVARRFPEQISGVFIRQIPQRPLTPERAGKAFRHLPRGRWMLFEDGQQLPPLGLLDTPLDDWHVSMAGGQLV